MKRLIFDIETVGEDFDSLDPTTQKNLTKWLEREALEESAYQTKLDDIKEGLSFSPLTGEIVVIGVLDPEKDQGMVYFQAPGETVKDFTEDGMSYKQRSEKEMLEQFWHGAAQYDEFVTFNGRGFDVPYLMVRSAIHGIKPTRNLMEGRYLYQQRGSTHIDLQDLLTFYGAVRRKGSLHLWCRAFGIESPKSEGMSGDEVGRFFKEGKHLDIARYNAGDLRATKELFEYWDKYLRF